MSCFLIPVAEVDWEDWADEAVSMALEKATPILLDGIQNWLFDTPMGKLLEKAAAGDAEEATEWWRMAAENGIC